MNNTNRALNRTILFIVGLVLLVLGGVAVTIASWPTAAEIWSQAAEGPADALAQAVEATRIAGGSVSWVGVGVVAAIVILIAVLVLALTSVSGRRSRMVLRSSGTQNPLGRITVTEAFVSDALKNSLAGRDEILSSQVTANDVKKRPVLHVAVIPRQNADPAKIVEHVDRLVENLAALTGEKTDTYISLHSSIRARFARDQRRVS
jgi:uncharacterized membrane protein